MIYNVMIGCYDYTVDEVEGVNKCASDMGEIEYKNHEIKIDKNLPLTRREGVLLREIINGLDEFMQIDLEKAQVQQLGNGLAMVLRNNPELAKMFYEDIRNQV